MKGILSLSRLGSFFPELSTAVDKEVLGRHQPCPSSWASTVCGLHPGVQLLGGKSGHLRSYKEVALVIKHSVY
jgi:hypothetical protein